MFTDINFEIKRGERVALIGNNGTGKTTILKILNGIVDADAGRFALGSKVQIGYYDQNTMFCIWRKLFSGDIRHLSDSH